MWAARFQCGKIDIPELAKAVSAALALDEETVRVGVRDVLKRIVLDRRKVRSGPKSQTR